MNNKKNITKVGILGVVLLGTTQCYIAATPAIAEFVQPKTQTIVVKQPMNVMDMAIEDAKFARLNVEVVEVAPWLKSENKKLRLSDSELIKILRNAGFKGDGLRMAWAITQKESGARPYAHNDNPKTGDNSYGLFQINMYRGLEEARQKAYKLESNEDLFDPSTNAKIAFKISRGGKSWGAWTTKDSASKLANNFPG